MPGFDGQGPNGSGPFTGRGRGYCIMKLGEYPSPEDSLNPKSLGELKELVQELKSALAKFQHRLDTLT